MFTFRFNKTAYYGNCCFSPKTKEEVKLLQQLAKQMRIQATVISQNDREDAWLLEGRTGEQSTREEVFNALS